MTDWRQRFLAIYAGVLTVVFVATVVWAVVVTRKHAIFDEITVHRINVVQPDGTIRLVIANQANFPGSFYKGKEIPRPDRTGAAGLLFVNDEGTEMGGLIYNGAMGQDGKPSGDGHLSFDQYDQDQMLSIDSGQDSGMKQTMITVTDPPDWSLFKSMAELTRIKGTIRHTEPV